MKITRRVFSPAKINLGLWLTGKRRDNYHDIATIFHTISLRDEIYISEGRLSVETSTGIPQEENLVFKALLELQKRTGKSIELSIFIDKNIPAGSGLGGGSSNVATVLKEANDILSLGMSDEELFEIAGCVSSDAPFFLMGGTALGTGRGDVLTPLKPLRLDVTLVLPGVSCSTREVYSKVRTSDLRSPDIESVVEAIYEGNYGVLENRLGEIACELYPEVGEVVRFLSGLGFKALVSGSGSAVFYIGEPTRELEAGARLRGWRVFKVESWLGV